MEITRNHPGYTVVQEGSAFIPVRLVGAAETWQSDDKGRHLSNVRKVWTVEGREVEGYIFNDLDDCMLVFSNVGHALNFLNKWVREQIGFGKALDTWEVYQSKRASEVRDLGDLQHRLSAMKAAHEIAETIIRQVIEGTVTREGARQMFATMTHVSENAYVVEFFGDLLDDIA